MRKYIIGNWKCNKNQQEVTEWVTAIGAALSGQYSDSLEVVLCPSVLYLAQLQGKVPNLSLGVQTLSPYGNGSYTGAVSAYQLAQYAKYALLGHAERRKYFQETEHSVVQQVRQALDAQLIPIIAVDDHNWASQLSFLEKSELEASIVMYEPPSAISTSVGGHAADLDQVVTAISEIRRALSVKAILYGGSISAANVAEYIGHAQIDGVVPGAASLDASEFIALVQRAAQATSRQ